MSSPVYAIFVDYMMAFDLINRRIAFQKIVNFQCLPTDIFRDIAAMLDINFITVTDGILYSKTMVQSNGVLQGGPKSSKDFILTACDVKHYTLQGISDVLLLTYADDILLFSTNLTQLQYALNNLVKWSTDNKLEMNVEKNKSYEIPERWQASGYRLHVIGLPLSLSTLTNILAFSTNLLVKLLPNMLLIVVVWDN
jgi:hypothetical protein